MNFIDLKKIFDIILRDNLWNILRSAYGCPEKFVYIIKLFYHKSHARGGRREGGREGRRGRGS